MSEVFREGMSKKEVADATCFGSYIFSEILIKDFVAEFPCGHIGSLTRSGRFQSCRYEVVSIFRSEYGKGRRT